LKTTDIKHKDGTTTSKISFLSPLNFNYGANMNSGSSLYFLNSSGKFGAMYFYKDNSNSLPATTISKDGVDTSGDISGNNLTVSGYLDVGSSINSKSLETDENIVANGDLSVDGGASIGTSLSIGTELFVYGEGVSAKKIGHTYRADSSSTGDDVSSTKTLSSGAYEADSDTCPNGYVVSCGFKVWTTSAPDYNSDGTPISWQGATLTGNALDVIVRTLFISEDLKYCWAGASNVGTSDARSIQAIAICHDPSQLVFSEDW